MIDDPECLFCHKRHDIEFDCEARKKSYARLKKKSDRFRKESLEKKIKWPRPDHTVKTWEACGLKCAICRGGVALCGYVRVPVGHPAYGKYYDDPELNGIRVHGGITFCQKSPDGFWFGFDCGHFGDWWGVTENGYSSEHTGRIWTVEDVAKETEKFARQLAEMGRTT